MEPAALMVASTFVDAFRFMPQHVSLLLEKTGQTAELAFTALAIALLIALPLGLWLGHKHRGLLLALPLLMILAGSSGLSWNDTMERVILRIGRTMTK